MSNLYNYDIASTMQQSFGMTAEIDGYMGDDNTNIPLMIIKYDSDNEGVVEIHLTDSEGNTSVASFDTKTLVRILDTLSF
jgi:hypothetical protein